MIWSTSFTPFWSNPLPDLHSPSFLWCSSRLSWHNSNAHPSCPTGSHLINQWPTWRFTEIRSRLRTVIGATALFIVLAAPSLLFGCPEFRGITSKNSLWTAQRCCKTEVLALESKAQSDLKGLSSSQNPTCAVVVLTSNSLRTIRPCRIQNRPVLTGKTPKNHREINGFLWLRFGFQTDIFCPKIGTWSELFLSSRPTWLEQHHSFRSSFQPEMFSLKGRKRWYNNCHLKTLSHFFGSGLSH